MEKSKLLAGGLLVAAFVAGIAVGNAGLALAGPTPEPKRYVDQLEVELQLNAAQKEAVSAIVQEHFREPMHELSAEVRPRVDSIKTQTRTEILKLLDPMQQQLFHERNARRDSSTAAKRQAHDQKANNRE